MSTFLQMLLRSLETGAIYALASLGIIIVYRTNFICVIFLDSYSWSRNGSADRR